MAGGCSGMCKSEMKMDCCKKDFFLCCKEGLELTDEQVANLKSIKMNFLKSKIQMEADLKIAELELKELMSAEKMDMAKVEKMIKSIYMMKAENKIAALKAHEKAKSILTPEQLLKKKEHHKKMMKGM
jgi:Spy/CpxP family protein refolding chaperone